MDLIFLYQNFYAELPLTLPSFIADLSQMFPEGIYDSKYIAEYIGRTSASYLEFVFFKAKLDNHKGKNKSNGLKVEFIRNKNSFPRLCGSFDDFDYENIDADSATICESYSLHGHCPLNKSCDKSHDIRTIVALESYEGKRKKKRKIQRREEEDENNSSLKETPVNGFSGSDGHRAGFDAFMTAYSFAYFLTSEGQDSEAKNKVYLSRKDTPLNIVKSAFAKNSKSHAVKLNKIHL